MLILLLVEVFCTWHNLKSKRWLKTSSSGYYEQHVTAAEEINCYFLLEQNTGAENINIYLKKNRPHCRQHQMYKLLNLIFLSLNGCI